MTTHLTISLLLDFDITRGVLPSEIIPSQALEDLQLPLLLYLIKFPEQDKVLRVLWSLICFAILISERIVKVYILWIFSGRIMHKPRQGLYSELNLGISTYWSSPRPVGQSAWAHCLNMGPTRMANLVSFRAPFLSILFSVNLCFLLYFFSLQYSALADNLLSVYPAFTEKITCISQLTNKTTLSGGVVPFYRHKCRGLEGEVICPGTQR